MKEKSLKEKLTTERTEGRLKDFIISIIIAVIIYFPIKAIVSYLSKNIITFIVIFLFWAWIYFILRFKT